MRRQDLRLAEQDALLAQLKKVVSQISSANLGFQNYARVVENKSKEEERKRISREIHDTTGYVLTTVKMLMESGLRSLSSSRDELKEILTFTKEQAVLGLEKVRASMRSLRRIEDWRVPFHLEVHKIASRFEIATGTEVAIDYCNLENIEDPQVRDVLYAIIQEGMINALRHGNATLVHITFWMSQDMTLMFLQDNGTGADMINDGVGMSGMRERIASISGSIEFKSGNEGFEIRVAVPTRKENHVEN